MNGAMKWKKNVPAKCKKCGNYGYCCLKGKDIEYCKPYSRSEALQAINVQMNMNI